MRYSILSGIVLSAYFISCLPSMPAWAQTSDAPAVIIPAAPPVMPFDPAGHDVHFANSTANALASGLDQLQQNLIILHNINTQYNRDTLNKFGEQYAHIPHLGSDFETAISGIDVSRISDASKTLSTNATEVLANFEDTRKVFDTQIDAIKTSIKANLPPGATKADVPQNFDKQPFLKRSVLGYHAGNLIEFDVALSTLNSNLVSINNTYLNLLRLSSEPAATLATIPHLDANLAAFDGIATGELNKISSLGQSMENINHQYDAWYTKGGLKAFATLDSSGNINDNDRALAAVGKSLETLHKQLRDSNDHMANILAPATPVAVNASTAPLFPQNTAESPPSSANDIPAYLSQATKPDVSNTQSSR